MASVIGFISQQVCNFGGAIEILADFAVQPLWSAVVRHRRIRRRELDTALGTRALSATTRARNDVLACRSLVEIRAGSVSA